ncbi:MAG: hypothetical protein ACRD0K_19805 [Egibacteraceae bacterium]
MALSYQGKSAAALSATGTLEERRQRLFAAYADAMFARRAEHPRFPKQKAVQWLAWLARALKRHQQTEFYLDRVQSDWLPTSAQQRMFTVGSVLFVGLLIGLPAVMLHGPTGLLLGLIAGLFYSLGERSTAGQSAARPRWSWSTARDALGATLLVGLVFGLVVGLSYDLIDELSNQPHGRLLAVLCYGPLAGLLVGLAKGLSTDQADTPRTAPDRERMGRSARIASSTTGPEPPNSWPRSNGCGSCRCPPPNAWPVPLAPADNPPIPAHPRPAAASACPNTPTDTRKRGGPLEIAPRTALNPDLHPHHPVPHSRMKHRG